MKSNILHFLNVGETRHAQLHYVMTYCSHVGNS